MYCLSGSAEAIPLAQAAPLLAEALPKYAPVDSLTIRTDRLSSCARRLGYSGIELDAYEGQVVEEEMPRFMDAFAPRDPGERPSAPGVLLAEQEPTTLQLLLNVPQLDTWAYKHPGGIIRDPAAWKTPLNIAIRMAMVDEGQRQVPETLSYRENFLLQTSLFLPIVGQRRVYREQN